MPNPLSKPSRVTENALQPVFFTSHETFALIRLLQDLPYSLTCQCFHTMMGHFTPFQFVGNSQFSW
ncbi:hypothetical protein THIOM_005108 [Candidatus Thiomargarita nelsonii]|uniref:Uncharacterized protein n=1 Tax=Candidatus Thiomargarita nelsonii TaxID=1003181 RepID=A0A176RU19_9GAMM|nr:hypothetical protein THIOM_005108 [Candidatus Thiomargarita nelsonii]